MERLKYILVWLRRIRHCRGFGIQSPSDYWLARYVLNEHWPYYEYETLGKGDGWLRRKMGRLYFRLANWRQPAVIESDDYRAYLEAGCRRAVFGASSELIIVTADKCRQQLPYIYDKTGDRTVLVVEDIRSNRELWREIVDDDRARVTFDLHYCGIVLFDSLRQKQNYIINF